MSLIISPDVRHKLTHKHHVSEPEIIECFANRDGRYLDDLRARHRTDPKTQWFIAETDRARKLKVCFMQHPNGDVEIKSAFTPNSDELWIYSQRAY